MVSGGSAAEAPRMEDRLTPPNLLPPPPPFPPSAQPEPVSPLRQEIAEMMQPAPPPTWRDEAKRMMARLDEVIHHRPGMAVLTVFGAGLAVGVASYEMLKPNSSPKKHALRSLDELQASLRELAAPAADRAAKMTHEGVKAVKHGVHSAADSKVMRRLRKLFA